MSLENISFGQFVEHLISTLSERGIKIPTENRNWHEFFYDIHKEKREGSLPA